MRSSMGCLVCARQWGAYVAQHERPVFERIGGQTPARHFKREFVSEKKVSPGENTVCGFGNGCIMKPKREHF